MKKSRLLVMLALLITVFATVGFRTSGFKMNSVLVVDLGGDIPETVPYNPLLSMFQEDKLLVLDKLTCIEGAASDKMIGALLVKISDAEYGYATAQEFREAILRFKEESDKPVYAYLEVESGGNKEYYIASAADQVYLSPASNLHLTGLSVFRFYLGGLWDKIYMDMQVNKIKEYKSFADMLSRKDMSDAERRMQSSLLDSLYSQFTGDIAQGREVSRDAVENWIDQAWIVPEKYVESGAADGLAYEDELIEKLAGKKPDLVAKEKQYLSYLESRQKSFGKKRVAVIFGVGSIIYGEQQSSPLSSMPVMASDDMVKQLEKVMKEPDIDAVIFRVNSGGGSALASDLIWRATQRVKKEKPVVVSMSDSAASGGYYVSCGADAVFAQPGTLTGSIGILTAHLSIGKLLDKIGVGTETLQRGEYATMNNFHRKLKEKEMEKVHQSIASTYDLFLSRVSQGRDLTKERVNEIGRGRVWTGAQAKEKGLVDDVGGYHAALQKVKKMLGVAPDEKVVLLYKREPASLWDIITGKAGERFQGMLTPAEKKLLNAVRVYGMFEPGRPLAITPGPMEVR
ncbi:MAG: signal peptide peptidase SppA [bacterium]